MNRFQKYFVDRYLNKELNFRVRLFNVLAMGGVVASLIASTTVMINNEPISSLVVNFIGCPISIFLMEYAKKTEKYQRCYVLTIFFVFLLLFPAIFFLGGGYQGAMPSFFVFAVVFTLFMLDGRKAIFIAAIELVTYICLCIYAYYYPQSVINLASEFMEMTDTVAGFSLASIVLCICMYIHFKLYNEQQRELARRNQELDERNAELDRINQNKTEFLSNISHELKTPLTVINSRIHTTSKELENYPQLTETQKSMKLISGEVERMGLMVSQLLDISRIDEGRMLMEFASEDIVEIIHSTMDIYYPVFSKNRNQLTLVCNENIAKAQCDRIRIMQVLVNLIGNAVRNTRDGTITVAAETKGKEAVITVSDTGEGIAAERIPYIFERYKSHKEVQTKETRAGWDTGTGLGLFICKHIVEAHGGRIWIDSELGIGTNARFTLPLDT